jgi:hypothetical protein
LEQLENFALASTFSDRVAFKKPGNDMSEILALRKAFESGKPVIPVWLPGAINTAVAPDFLSLFTWVDLSTGLTEKGIDRLVWAVTGAQPTPNKPQGPQGQI